MRTRVAYVARAAWSGLTGAKSFPISSGLLFDPSMLGDRGRFRWIHASRGTSPQASERNVRLTSGSPTFRSAGNLWFRAHGGPVHERTLPGIVGSDPVPSTQLRVPVRVLQARRTQGFVAVQGDEGLGQSVEYEGVSPPGRPVPADLPRHGPNGRGPADCAGEERLRGQDRIRRGSCTDTPHPSTIPAEATPRARTSEWSLRRCRTADTPSDGRSQPSRAERRR